MTELATQDTAETPELPTNAQDLMRILDDLGIAYDVHAHRPVFTVAESLDIEKGIAGVHCRNLFLCDRRKAMFLVVAANETRIDLKKLQGLIGSDRLSFGSPERLWTYLGVRPGSVCPFSIVNDKSGAVKIILDSDMMVGDRVNYHPMENHMTVGLAPADLIRFIEFTGHVPHIVDLSPAVPD